MTSDEKAAAVNTCKHLLPFLEQILSDGARITGIEQGYSEARQVVRLSRAPMVSGALPETVERFESKDSHYHPVSEAGLVCRNCKQVLAWAQ
jgi:hypothetical protein